MTGHFTSYENRTDHELATTEWPDLDDVAAASLAFHEYPQMETG